MNIPLLQPASLKDPAFAAALRGFAPDLAVVVAFRILPREVFTIPCLGSFNLHASLLPRYRGAAPINWALMNGDQTTGVTTFFLEDAVDTGNTLLQSPLIIGPNDDAGVVHDALARLGAGLVIQTVRGIEAGTIVPQPQDGALASPAPKIFREHCRIRWTLPVRQIHDFVRGLSPHPAAWTTHRGRLIKIYRTRLSDTVVSGASGTVDVHGQSICISCPDGVIEILELQQEGHRRMSAPEFLRGYILSPGDCFE
jgi:methionyl-tRNA formyltransferase